MEEITITKERYEHLLECEKFTMLCLNTIVTDSLGSIDLALGISDDVKAKAVKAAFNEALKNK